MSTARAPLTGRSSDSAQYHQRRIRNRHHADVYGGGLDTGDMIARTEVPIEDDDTAGTMFEKLSRRRGARDQTPRLVKGKVDAEPQDDTKATYAPNLTRDDERIDWTRTSREIYNQIRGLVPTPADLRCGTGCLKYGRG